LQLASGTKPVGVVRTCAAAVADGTVTHFVTHKMVANRVDGCSARQSSFFSILSKKNLR
jgi:hypothetical protein